MKRNVLVFLLFLFASIGFGWSGLLEIVNDTGFTFYWIYVCHQSQDQWGLDRLGNDVLLDQETFSIFLEHYPDGVFDIRIIDEDNDTYTFRSKVLEPVTILRVRLSDLDRRR
jgi:hypothetical protein